MTSIEEKAKQYTRQQAMKKVKGEWQSQEAVEAQIDLFYNEEFEQAYYDAYRQALLDIRREINEKTAQGYKFPLLHIFSWIDIKLGLKTEDK